MEGNTGGTLSVTGRPLPPRDASKYLDADAREKELVAQLDPDTRREWESFGHKRIEPVFQDRVFVVYQAQGRDSKDVQRPPKILTTVRALSFIAKDEFGSMIRLLDEKANKALEVGHVPVKLFDYPIFVAMPTDFTVKWDAHYHGGKLLWTLSYLMFIKARNKSEFFSKNNVYMETPNKLREKLYPHLDLKLDL